MGGYNEGSYVGGIYQNDGNWNDDNRNAAQYMTVLSAVSDEAGGRQAVNGYHAVQFDRMERLDKQTVLDGVYLKTVWLRLFPVAVVSTPVVAVPLCRRGHTYATVWFATTKPSKAADCSCCPAVWCPVAA